MMEISKQASKDLFYFVKRKHWTIDKPWTNYGHWYIIYRT